MERVVKVYTHLPEGVLKFHGLQGDEALSQLFEFEVELVSDSHSLDLKQLLGTSMTLEIEMALGTRRFLDGQVTRCALIGREGRSGRHYLYRATLRPWLWYLSQSSDSKIFQNKAVPDVVREVLSDYEYPVEFALGNSYRVWEYCVQYQETDFAFVSRLLEHEGIYYWFKHDHGKHTLVLTDDLTKHAPLPGGASIPFFGPDRIAAPQEEYVGSWEVMEQITPGRFVTNDYHFKTPGAALEARRNNPGPYQNGDLEVYEWQGGYTSAADAEHYTRVRLEGLQCRRELMVGACNARGIAPGSLFSLRNHPRQDENREYLVVGARYRIRNGGYASGEGDGSEFSIDFTVLPSHTQFRPARNTPMPHTHGPQTARVVGKQGEEIWTDSYGRVKVQFHWDRYGQRNENSSCWVRVSSPWAGGGFGGIQLPRVGDEVIVDFIGGHPDRPIIIGRVYNATNMPPWNLPENATQSGFLSRSKDGTPRTANAFMFEDKPGHEEVWLHAERNARTEIEQDEFHNTDGNRSTVIGVNDTTAIRASRSIEITDTDSLTVGGTRDVSITGHENYTVKASRKLEVQDGMCTEIYGQGLSTTVSAVGETREVFGPFKETLHDTETRTVDGLVDETFNGGERRTVNNHSTLTIRDGQTVVVATGDVVREVSSGSLSEVANGQISIQSRTAGVDIRSPLPVNVNSSTDISMIAQKLKEMSIGNWFRATPFGLTLTLAQTTIGMLNTSIWGSNLSMNFCNTEFSALDTRVNGISLRMTMCDIKKAKLDTEVAGIKTTLCGLYTVL